MAFVPNPLSNFEQYSYHISLSLPTPEQGGPSKSGPSPQSIIVAETGKTALYYIEQLDIDTVAPTGGNGTITNITGALLTIIEPNGFTLFDRLVSGAVSLGWQSINELIFHLDISFNGWLPSGVAVPRFASSKYRCYLTNIDCESNQMKTTYKFHLSNFQRMAINEDQISPQRQFRSEIKKTLQETIKEFERLYNKTMPGTQNSTKQDVGIPDQYVFTLGPKLSQLNLKMPTEVESDTTVNQKDGDGKLYYYYGGERADEALMKLAANAKDIAKAMIPNLQSDGTINFTSPNTQLLNFFTFDIDVSYGQFNQQLNRYQKIYEYTIDIVPRPDLQDLPPGLDGNAAHVAALIQNGLLVKRYDHYFTGKNTEVLEAKIDFNSTFNSYRPAYNNIPSEYGHSITNEGRENEKGFGPFRKGPLTQLANALLAIASKLGIVKNISGFNSNLLETLPLSGAIKGYVSGKVIPVNSPEKIVSGVSTIKNPEAVNQLGSIQFYYDRHVQQFLPLVNISLTIRGDPYWLDNNIGQPSSYNTGTQCLYYYSRTSEPANETTGLPFNVGKISFEGVYHIINVKSTFSGGVFTQELTCTINTNGLGVQLPP